MCSVCQQHERGDKNYFHENYCPFKIGLFFSMYKVNEKSTLRSVTNYCYHQKKNFFEPIRTVKCKFFPSTKKWTGR